MILAGWDPSKGQLVTGSRVQKMTLDNGTVLDRNDNSTEIVLASNDFEIAGGDGYTMFRSIKNIGEGDVLDVLFEKYIIKLTKEGKGAFSIASSQNRIKAITNYQYQPYSASITVKNEWIVAKKAGKAVIAVKTISGNKTAKCTITVVEPVKSVKLSKAKLTLKVGQNSTIKAMINSANATNKKVVWTSSNKSIATVNAKGKIIAKKRSTVKITVKTVDGGKKAVCKN